MRSSPLVPRAHCDRPAAVVTTTVPQTLNLFHRELIRQVLKTHDVHLVSSPGPDLDALERDLPVVCHRLPMARDISVRADIAATWQWFELLRRLRPDVLISASPKASLLAQIVALVCAVPQRLYYVGGLRLEGARGFKRRVLTVMERLTGWCAHHVVTNSASLSARCHELSLFSAQKLTTTKPGSSHGVDSVHFAPMARDEALAHKLHLQSGLPVLGFVGRLTHDKGIDTLIEGAEILQGRGQPVQLLILGPQDEVDSQVYLDRLHRAGIHLTVLGRQADVRPYFALMDVHVLPSHREGFPNVVLEASAMGVPTVTTTATGCVDSVIPSVTGLTHPVGDAEGFANSVAEALERGAELGGAARTWVVDEFAPEPVVKTLLAPLDLASVANHAPRDADRGVPT